MTRTTSRFFWQLRDEQIDLLDASIDTAMLLKGVVRPGKSPGSRAESLLRNSGIDKLRVRVSKTNTQPFFLHTPARESTKRVLVVPHPVHLAKMLSSLPSAGAPLKIEVTQVAPSSTPVLPTSTATAIVGGHRTSVVAQSFADRIFITVTQLDKFGVLYSATTSTAPSSLDHDGDADLDHARTAASALPPPLPTTSVSKLVGTEPSPAHTALYQLYIAQIASIVKHHSPTDPRPLLVSLALRPTASAASTRDRVDTGQEYADSDDEADSLLLTNEDERQRFMAIMELVQKCRVW